MSILVLFTAADYNNGVVGIFCRSLAVLYFFYEYDDVVFKLIKKVLKWLLYK